MSKVSRLLAIDASVLRSAGEKEGHSAHCTEVLTSILSICHRSVICIEIQQEWNKHQSRIASKWRAAMNARKKLVKTDIKVHRQRISGQVNSILELTNTQRTALNKDVHMLAASAHSDHVIVSSDQSLKALCQAHLTESVEWLLLLDSDTAVQRRTLISRLIELAKEKPYPQLPP